jgi:hypothetical protein
MVSSNLGELNLGEWGLGELGVEGPPSTKCRVLDFGFILDIYVYPDTAAATATALAPTCNSHVTNLEKGVATEKACSGGYTKSIVRYLQGGQFGNFVMPLTRVADPYTTLALTPAIIAAPTSTLTLPLSITNDPYTVLPRLWALRLWPDSFADTTCTGGYTKHITRRSAATPAINVQVISTTATLPAFTATGRALVSPVTVTTTAQIPAPLPMVRVTIAATDRKSVV